MSWEALGRDPVPGDPGAVRALADRFDTVDDGAMRVFRGLHGADRSLGPQVWRGPAATSFQGELQQVTPLVVELAGAFRSARCALRRYAEVLEDAQCTARQAEAQAAEAIRSRDAAVRERNRAEQEKATHVANKVATAGRLADVRVIRAGLGVLDPAYLQVLDRYEDQMRAQHNRAAAGEADARGRERAAEHEIREGEEALQRARERAERARQEREDAARVLVAELQNNKPVGAASRLPSFGDRAHRVVDAITDVADVLEHGISKYHINGKEHSRWKPGWGGFRRILHIDARTVSKLGKLGKLLGPLGIGIEVADAARYQYRSDANRVDISDEERRARADGAGIARGTYEFVANRAIIGLFTFAGSLIPIPGVGTALGFGVGVLASELFDRIDGPLEELVTRGGAEAFGRAQRAYEQFRTLLGNEASDFAREARNTTGELWKGITKCLW
jgi:uncharacterized protein YukE